MLRDAADKADLDTPQPAYIYGMLLAGEFSHVDIPLQLLKPSSAFRHSRTRGSQSHPVGCLSQLCASTVQVRMAVRVRTAGVCFRPVLSVQYYSLASQGGEIEADMALSKWFLCGAESYFDKNETLAYTFADKAARKGLASAEFALDTITKWVWEPNAM